MEFPSVTDCPVKLDAEDRHRITQSPEGNITDITKSADKEDVAKSFDTEDCRHDVAKSADTKRDHDVVELTDKDWHDVAKLPGTESDTHDVGKSADAGGDVHNLAKSDDEEKCDVPKPSGTEGDRHDMAKSSDTKEEQLDVSKSSDTEGGDGYYVTKSADISEELDSLAFRYLDIMQSVIYEQDRLREALGDGFVNMAKARYIMGNKSVSILQINEGEMKADCLVYMERDSYGSVEYTNFKITEESNRDVEEGNLKLRQRKGKNQKDDFDKINNSGISEDNLGKENIEQKNESYSPGSRNPLQWFGVLVPQSLRTCQSQFREGLVVAARIASLESELLSVYARYRELFAKEKEIQNNS